MWGWIMFAHLHLCDIDEFATVYVIAGEAATTAATWKFLFAMWYIARLHAMKRLKKQYDNNIAFKILLYYNFNQINCIFELKFRKSIEFERENVLYEKNGFAERSKVLARYRSEK